MVNRLEVSQPEIDVAVIGAGVIGLAVGRAFALQGREVMIFESEPSIGMHTSSRNSEVIHSGIYYKPGSLKAKLCVEGKEQIYEYCDSHAISHNKIGKVVVASSEAEVTKLEKLKEQGEVNGVIDLEWLTEEDIKQIEPLVHGVLGLWSPSTGIIDSDAFLKSLQHEAEEHQAWIIPSTPVLGGEILEEKKLLKIGGREPVTVSSKVVVNAAGLYAPQVARSISGVPSDKIPQSYLTKGHYFMLSGKSPFSYLVYPLPEKGGLGIHATINLAGKTRFGPDVTSIDSVDYSFDETLSEKFYQIIRSYYPALQDGQLYPGYTGIRPKIGSPDEVQDFLIQGPHEHGIEGLVNLFGIESPGLTASLAIAEYVVSMI